METIQMSNQETLPAIADDGFDHDGGDNRLIKGEVIKCVDGNWSIRNGDALPAGSQFIALATATALQKWQDGMPVETILKVSGKSFPDVQELNHAIPEDDWEEGLDGKPRPPWVLQQIVYLLDPRTASVFTFINSTWGAQHAVRTLRDRVAIMRSLRGSRVVPLVTLDSRPFKGKYGTKIRPEFTVEDWRDLSGPSPASPSLAPAPNTPMIEHVGKSVEKPTTEEILNDELPSFDLDDDGPGEDDEVEFVEQTPPKSSRKKKKK
jgi:hypothetical protein